MFRIHGYFEPLLHCYLLFIVHRRSLQTDLCTKKGALPAELMRRLLKGRDHVTEKTKDLFQTNHRLTSKIFLGKRMFSILALKENIL